jgi:hypothetical protein
MTPAAQGQRNPYKGSPPRPWVRVRFLAPGGTAIDLDLLADTGCPFAFIVSQHHLGSLTTGHAPDLQTNFGLLTGGWLLIDMPDIGVVQRLLGYASDTVVAATQASHADFEGLLGLPLLRLTECGGDADWFWVRPQAAPP